MTHILVVEGVSGRKTAFNVMIRPQTLLITFGCKSKLYGDPQNVVCQRG